MGVVYGLSAAFCWGLGDFLIAKLTRRIGTPRAMFWTQLASLTVWACALLLAGDRREVATTLWLVAIATGVLHVVGLLTTYRAFEIGTLSIVSPICSGYAVVTALFAILLSGERLPLPVILGTVLLIGGVILATRASSADVTEAAKPPLTGVPHALVSAVAFGAMFWLFDGLVGPLGYLWPLLILKIMATVSGAWSLKLSPPAEAEASTETSRGGVWALALGVAAADSTAWIALIFGLATKEYITVVVALSSLFSAVTVLLAWLFLRERLARLQWVGVFALLLGILLVSLRQVL